MEPNSSSPAQLLGGRYQIVRQLGAGGFGQTFLAQDLHLPGQPTCVVKQLKPQVNTEEALQVARRLFDTEAKTLYQLGSHPQIPALLAHFEETQDFYLAQEFIDGRSLEDELAASSPWTDAQAIAFLEDILSTLAFIHEHRVIHRDLKPANLIRRHRDQRIVLIDFGAVKEVSSQGMSSPSNISHTISIGTQGYMPNEQIAGRPQFCSDVYAVGMMTIQALTGRHPTQIQPHVQTGELDWHGLAAQRHPSLIALLDYMVRYDFRSRYDTAAAALAALQSLPSNLAPPQAAPPQAAPPQAPVASSVTPPIARPPQAAPPSQSTMRTVAVGSPMPDTGMGQTAYPQAQASDVPPSPPSRKLIVPLGIGMTLGLLLLGIGAMAWRAYVPMPQAETASPPPDPSSPSVSPDSPAATTLPTEPKADAPAEAPEKAPAETPPPEVSDPPVDNPVEDPVENSVENPADDDSAPGSALDLATAQTTVETFYQHVSNQAWDEARQLFSASLAAQFDPDFFSQFQQVTVENLRVTQQTTDTIELVGQNTYVYLDDSSQEEVRTFTVQLVAGQPRIVASSFVRVTKARN